MCDWFENFNVQQHGFLYVDSEYFRWFANNEENRTELMFREMLLWKGLTYYVNNNRFVEIWNNFNNQLLDGYPVVTRVFLNHLHEPTIYPILDKNVWQAMININGINGLPELPASWEEHYQNHYRNFFNVQYQQINGIDFPQINGVDEEIVKRRVLDRALWEYGRMLP
jgi:hypothetical protein